MANKNNHSHNHNSNSYNKEHKTAQNTHTPSEWPVNVQSVCQAGFIVLLKRDVTFDVHAELWPQLQLQFLGLFKIVALTFALTPGGNAIISVPLSHKFEALKLPSFYVRK